jgi:hypothetical protein
MRDDQVKVDEILKRTQDLDCGSDGGLAEGTGTMGFAVTAEGTVLWKGSGPVDGDPHTASSRRSELFAFGGLLELLHMLVATSHVLQNQPSQSRTVRVWIDSTSAIRQIKRILEDKPTLPRYPNDADILAHIRWLTKKPSPFRISIHWVKAHQSVADDIEKLPISTRINILVDELATDYRMNVKSTAQRPRPNSLFFPEN